MLTVKVYEESNARAGYTCSSYRLIPAGQTPPRQFPRHEAPAELSYEPAGTDRVELLDADGDVRQVIWPQPTTVIYVVNGHGNTVDTMRFRHLPCGNAAGAPAKDARAA